MQQNSTNFLKGHRNTRLGGLSGRVELVPLGNRIYLPKCGHDKSCQHEASSFARVRPVRSSSFADDRTIFEHTRLPLPKWFSAIYLTGAGQAKNSAQLLSKMIGVSWPPIKCQGICVSPWATAAVVADSQKLLEVDDAFIQGHKLGKEFAGLRAKTGDIRVEQRENGMGFMAKLVSNENNKLH